MGDMGQPRARDIDHPPAHGRARPGSRPRMRIVRRHGAVCTLSVRLGLLLWPSAAPACRRNPAWPAAISRSPITTLLAPMRQKMIAPRHRNGPAPRSAAADWRARACCTIWPASKACGNGDEQQLRAPPDWRPPAHRPGRHCRGYARCPGSPTAPSSTTSSGSCAFDAVGDQLAHPAIAHQHGMIR